MMISIAKFETELNEIETFLNHINLLDERNYSPKEIEDISIFRNISLHDNWSLNLKQNIYNFQLKDNSLLIFRINAKEKSASYTYIECPFNCESYEDFLLEYEIDDYHDKALIEEYTTYVEQCEIMRNSLYVRYDLDFQSYQIGLHPASHLHIGHENNLRLGLDKIINPKTFLNFILRQNYIPIWKKLISEDPLSDWIQKHKKEKKNLHVINESHFSSFDLEELYIN